MILSLTRQIVNISFHNSDVKNFQHGYESRNLHIYTKDAIESALPYAIRLRLLINNVLFVIYPTPKPLPKKYLYWRTLAVRQYKQDNRR